jgi:ATP adenylyltransferase
LMLKLPHKNMKVYEPLRAEYRRNRGKNKICQFCDFKIIKTQECETLSGKYWMVFVNLYPYMDGNLMIIPKRHVKDTNDLDSKEKSEFFDILKKVKIRLS